MSEVCRVCMKPLSGMVNIFDGAPQQENGVSIADMIFQSTGFPVERGDHLPETICPSCLQHAQNASEFNHDYERSPRVKEEIIEGDCEIYRDFEIRFLYSPAEAESAANTQFNGEKKIVKCEPNSQEIEQDLLPVKTDNLADTDDDDQDFSRDKLTFRCPSCPRAFELKSDYRKHLRSHGMLSPFYCYLCPKYFGQLSTLEAHFRTHPEKRSHKCSECGKSFRMKHHLEAHKHRHTGERPHRCPQCPKTFNTPVHLRIHMKAHSADLRARTDNTADAGDDDQDSSNDQIEEDLLPVRTDNSGDADDDDQDSRNDLVIFKCPSCPTAFELRPDYRKHLRSHGTKPPFNCYLCSKSFTQCSSLETHFLTHTDERSHKCFECGKSFRLKHHLEKHKRSHPGGDLLPVRANNSTDANDDDHGVSSDKLTFKCPSCPESFKLRPDYIQHLRSHGRNPPFHCYLCPNFFVQFSSLQRHFRTHHQHTAEQGTENGSDLQKTENSANADGDDQDFSNDQLPFKCPRCPKAFKLRSDFRKHLRSHGTNPPFKCYLCSKSFTQLCSLETHFLTHTGERPHRCSECGKSFRLKHHLENHKQSHARERAHRCSECPKTFITPGHLKMHIVKAHSAAEDEGPKANPESPEDSDHSDTPVAGLFEEVVCDQPERELNQFDCPDGMKEDTLREDYDALNNNIDADSGDHELPFKCPQCPRRFQNRTGLEKHIPLHVRKLTHQCSYCSSSFPTPGCLNKHLRVHTAERKFTCPDCPKAFLNVIQLSEHSRTHTKEKPFQCPECLMFFSYKCSLKKHMRIHSGERPYKCSECFQSFSQLAGLKNHNLIHTGGASFKCSRCSKVYASKPLLWAHKCIYRSLRPHKCSLCTAAFDKPLSLMKHMECHTQRPTLECPHCPKSFQRRTALESHILSHIAPQVFKCPQCPGRTFNSSHRFCKHIRAHDRPFHCMNCSLPFESESARKEHTCGQSEKLPFKCSMCPTRFAQESELEDHVELHAGKIPFICPYCSKFFSLKSLYLKHMRELEPGAETVH